MIGKPTEENQVLPSFSPRVCGCVVSLLLLSEPESLMSGLFTQEVRAEPAIRYYWLANLNVTSDCFCVLFVEGHFYFTTIRLQKGDRGGTVVKMLYYKSEGRRFDPRWCHWNFSLTQFFRSHYGPGVESASNRNE